MNLHICNANVLHKIVCMVNKLPGSWFEKFLVLGGIRAYKHHRLLSKRRSINPIMMRVHIPLETTNFSLSFAVMKITCYENQQNSVSECTDCFMLMISFVFSYELLMISSSFALSWRKVLIPLETTNFSLFFAMSD